MLARCCSCLLANIWNALSGFSTIAVPVAERRCPRINRCRSLVPLGIFSSSNRHLALGLSLSFTFQANTFGLSHLTTHDLVSHSLFTSVRLFRPRKEAPRRGSSESIHSAPWNSLLNSAEMLISLTRSQTTSGEAAMSISTVTPGPSAMRLSTSSVGPVACSFV